MIMTMGMLILGIMAILRLKKQRDDDEKIEKPLICSPPGQEWNHRIERVPGDDGQKNARQQHHQEQSMTMAPCSHSTGDHSLLCQLDNAIFQCHDHDTKQSFSAMTVALCICLVLVQ